ncbi:hypothetical protein DAI22_05g048200 [Oryza sativa Japonica Group]|nr:hypothetical protein DAI22_05g048200 [Oryza sativa Japonica Group]
MREGERDGVRGGDSPAATGARYQCLRVCRGKNLLSVSGWKKPSANLPLRETSFSSFGSASPAEIVSVAAEHAGECMEKSRGTRMMKVRSMVNEEDKNEECDFGVWGCWCHDICLLTWLKNIHAASLHLDVLSLRHFCSLALTSTSKPTLLPILVISHYWSTAVKLGILDCTVFKTVTELILLTL